MAVAVLLLGGCAGGTTDPPPASPTQVTKRTQQFSTTFSARDRTQRAVGARLEKTYGWSEYTGRTRFLDDRFDAEMLVANDFVKGNGTFEGFVTLESPTGQIGLRITGVAAPGAQGDGSAYSGETEVIGGTGAYVTLAGRGRFTGQRTGEVGTSIDVDVTLELINPS